MEIGQVYAMPFDVPESGQPKPVSVSGGEPASSPVVHQKSARTQPTQEAAMAGFQAKENLSQPPDLEKRIKEMMERINRYLQENKLDLHFYLHEGVGRLALQVIQDSTGKILREYPPKEWLDLEAKLREMVGVFVDVDNA